MATFNSCVLVGRLTKDPELKTTSTGKSVCPFTLAIDKGYGKEGANFIDCEAWGKTAEFVANYLKKGRQALVGGRLDQQVWEKDGQKRSRLQVTVNIVEALDNGKKAEAQEEEVSQAEKEENLDIGSIPF